MKKCQECGVEYERYLVDDMLERNRAKHNVPRKGEHQDLCLDCRAKRVAAAPDLPGFEVTFKS
jgi:hypothetical protein